MPNAALNPAAATPPAGQHMGAGSFFGAVQARHEQCGAIFTDLRHSTPRKLPMHSHELPFFALLLEGHYGERYGRQQTQFSPFTLMFRPAGIPHQDEIGPRGVRLYEIELRPSWQKRLAECSAFLDTPRDDVAGGALLWLSMKLFREVQASTVADELAVESLLSEIALCAARSPHRESRHAPGWLSRILEKLKTEHCRRFTLDELAREARVHPVHLSRVFRRCVGEGISEYVHRLRVRAACERMLAPETSLADVGFSTGFADQSHFTRSFRKITGMTPASFRSLLRGPS
ncbi:MAG TPA: AraC family transcriptional regulator [Candidatus Angelobacter sp.]|nr:AraC family transcriptional regulator [Candidatus Angelobacter sp.]